MSIAQAHALQKVPCVANSGDAWTTDRLHRVGFIIVGVLVLVTTGFGIQINPLDAPSIVAAIILLLGVPHGAFDVAVWQHRNMTAGRQSVIQMLALYTGLAGAAFGLWIVAPEITLPAFLMMSIYHFSHDWKPLLSKVHRWVIAVAMIASPAVFFSRDVIEIFNWLAPSDYSALVACVMQVVALPALLASAFIVSPLAQRDPLAAFEVVVVLALALLTPPMVFFIIYFCGLHSPRHIIGVHRELQPVNASSFLLAAWPYAPIAIAGTVMGAVLLSSLPVGSALLGTVFMALGALTVPHMLLIDRSSVLTK